MFDSLMQSKQSRLQACLRSSHCILTLNEFTSNEGNHPSSHPTQ
jgi:hypothetical protein